MSTVQTSNAMVPAEATIRRLLTLRLFQSREGQCPRFVMLIMPNCTRRVEYFQCRIRWVRTGDARWPGYQVSPPLRVAVGANVCNWADRKSTRLNSSHLVISYAVFCLKKKTT